MTKFSRFARIAEVVFFTDWLDTTFEGVIAKRTSATPFEVEPSLPVRIRFTELKDGVAPGVLVSRPYAPRTLVAVVENATAATIESGPGPARPFAPI